jgi:glycosyltransferase involved in cell wall biosynthesis
MPPRRHQHGCAFGGAERDGWPTSGGHWGSAQCASVGDCGYADGLRAVMCHDNVQHLAMLRTHKRVAKLATLIRGMPQLVAHHTLRRFSEPPRLRFVYHDYGGPTRYRVDHQIEQACIAGFAVHDAPLDGPANPYDLAECDLLYLYRLPLTLRTWPLIIAARRMHIPIVFDTDDLVWDPAERQYSYLDDHYAPKDVRRALRTIRRTNASMRLANALVCSTPYLARLAARSFHQPAYVNPNALSRAMVEAAERAYAQQQTRRAARGAIIGYFSGTPRVHEEDLASIGPALCALLDRHTEVVLRIYGGLQLTGALAGPRYATRIEQRPLVSWSDLLEHIAQVDITIAPLVDNPQRRAKSAVKYMEPALVGVPTIAVGLDPYQDEIKHGMNGLLASTTEEWISGLAALIQSPDLRQRLGEAARIDVLARHTTTIRAANFASIIGQVVS